MPPIKVVFYKEDDGSVPVLDWLKEAKKRDKKAFAKCLVRIAELSAQGHVLRRPLADYLREGIYELRVAHRHINYRILYFFHKSSVCVLAHSIVKESSIPKKDIEIAIRCKIRFEEDPGGHTHEQEKEDK